jgi:hypothetical protein
MAAGDVEGDDHSVACLDVRDLAADLLDYAHRLVPEDIAGSHEGPENLIEVEVGAAQSGRRDTHDGVGGLLEDGFRDVVYADISPTVPGNCFHFVSSI